LIGTLRVALSQNITPARYAFGTAAALEMFAGTQSGAAVENALDALWQDAQPEVSERQRVLELIFSARPNLARWRASGLADLTTFV
jgi:hypothetical protein